MKMASENMKGSGLEFCNRVNLVKHMLGIHILQSNHLEQKFHQNPNSFFVLDSSLSKYAMPNENGFGKYERQWFGVLQSSESCKTHVGHPYSSIKSSGTEIPPESQLVFWSWFFTFEKGHAK